MRRGLAALALTLVALPGAAALDAFPAEDEAGAREARFLLRVQPGAPLRVESDAPVRVGLARHGEAPAALMEAPADLRAPSDASWHGLAGVVHLVVERDDPARAVLLTAWQEPDEGVALEWPAHRKPAPGPSAPLALAGLLAALYVGRRRP